MSKRIVTVIGARPQFIKASALSRVLSNQPDIEEIIVHTGQHFDQDMSDVFFQELSIPKPKYFLNVHGSSHGQMTAQMLAKVEEVLMLEKPSMVLVYGDTNSTLAGALAAAKLNIPVAHVEAGLRSFNKAMPEEINRIMTDHVSTFLFCPTVQSVRNLSIEGITEQVHHVGDIMYDATLYAKKLIQSQQQFFDDKFKQIDFKFALMTIHRQESTQDIDAFARLMDYAHAFAENRNIKLIFPVHPRIKNMLSNYHNSPFFSFQTPLTYFDMHYLLGRSEAVLTDSGGLQKEAYFHEVPCVTLRSETEWVETIDAGWNRLWQNDSYQERKTITDYGSGNGAELIKEVIAG